MSNKKVTLLAMGVTKSNTFSNMNIIPNNNIISVIRDVTVILEI